MEGSWRIMKRKMYYTRKFRTKADFIQAIEKYFDYYATKRVQRNLGVLTPFEFHKTKLLNAA